MKKLTNSALEIYFSKRFEGNIWRIFPDECKGSDQWIAEIRHQQSKTVSHALIDLSVPEIKWYAQLPFVDWSTQLTAAGAGYLFFHQYRQPDLPQPDDLIAADMETGAHAWTLPQHNLVKIINDKQLLTLHRQPAGLSEIPYRIINGQPVKEEQVQISSSDISYKAPVRYLPDNIYFSQISSFLKRLTGITDPVVIDYLEAGQFLVLSYYIYSEEAYEQWLLITDINGTVQHSQKTGENLTGIGIETILLKNNKLVLLTNNNEFTSLNFTQ